ncbi:MAG: TetR/AcrR family transcriptional regulator [Chitinivorax sp.]
MRYTPEHKEKTRARLLAEGGSIAKKNGFASTGVDTLMAAVGLTSGAFYAHFGSKAELLEAIVDKELGRSLDWFSDRNREQLLQALQAYLSLAHVAHPERGCPLPSLSAEVARADEQTRQTFERRLSEVVAAVQHHAADTPTAWAIVAQVAGAVMLARAMASEEARQQLLDGVLRQVQQQLAKPD